MFNVIQGKNVLSKNHINDFNNGKCIFLVYIRYTNLEYNHSLPIKRLRPSYNKYLNSSMLYFIQLSDNK